MSRVQRGVARRERVQRVLGDGEAAAQVQLCHGTRELRYPSHTARSGLGLARVVRRFVWPRHANGMLVNDATRSLRV